LQQSALLAIVSGLVMMVQLHRQHRGSFSHSRWGLALVIGALASVGALVIAFIEAAAARREGRANEDGAASNLGRRFHRERSARLITLASLFVALATMAVARYSWKGAPACTCFDIGVCCTPFRRRRCWRQRSP
jgi:putative copper export protein